MNAEPLEGFYDDDDDDDKSNICSEVLDYKCHWFLQKCIYTKW